MAAVAHMDDTLSRTWMTHWQHYLREVQQPCQGSELLRKDDTGGADDRGRQYAAQALGTCTRVFAMNGVRKMREGLMTGGGSMLPRHAAPAHVCSR